MASILSKRHIFFSLAVSCGLNMAPVWAVAPFKARVEKRTNVVNLKLKDQILRSAKVADVLNTQDSLLTGERSRAELMFQDGSLARVGSNANFTVSSDTRSIQVQKGLILLHVPPGLGGAKIQSRSAVAAIKGDTVLFQEGIIPSTDPMRAAKKFTKIIALSQEPNAPDGSISVTYIDPNEGTSKEIALKFGQMFVLTQEGVKIASINVSNLMESSSILSISKDAQKSNFESQLASAFQAEVIGKAEEQKQQVSDGLLASTGTVLSTLPTSIAISPETTKTQVSNESSFSREQNSDLKIDLLSSASIPSIYSSPGQSGSTPSTINQVKLVNQILGNNASIAANSVILSTAKGALSFEPSSSYFKSTINFPFGSNPSLSFDYTFTVDKFNPVQLNDQFIVDILNNSGISSNLLTIQKITDLPFVLDPSTGQFTATSSFNQDISNIVNPGESAKVTFTIQDRPAADSGKDASVTVTNIKVNGQPTLLQP
jgi:FecR protein